MHESENKSTPDYYWLHEISSAEEFLRFGFDKFYHSKKILDLVDLEYRRMEQQGKSPIEVQMNVQKLCFMVQNSHLTISISEQEDDMVKNLIGHNHVKTIVLSNIYEDLVSTVRNKDGYLYDFLFVGNFLHTPNVEAVEIICDFLAIELPNKQFAIVGGGAKTQCFDSSRLKNVHWLGQVEDLRNVYSNSKCVIAPLKTGAGVKGKVIEALSFGVPVIGTKIAWEGIPLPEKPMGWHVETIDDFKKAIYELDEYLEQTLSIGDALRLNSKFSLTTARNKLDSYFKENK
jgi:glycosyltransferase involved in cell wall biosynthesis